MKDYDSLKSIVARALDILYEKDGSIIKRQLHEQCVVFRFGLYFRDLLLDTEFSCYDLDAEYNKDGDDLKRLECKPQGFRPDIILHKRESNSHNILVLEFKYEQNDSKVEEDIKKIKELTHKNGKYRYKLGASIIITPCRKDVKIEWHE